MAVRDLRRGAHEQWSDRNQTLRHAGEKRLRDDKALLHNPADLSAVGGPDDQAAYGRTRSDNGYYPWNPHGGPYDRDTFVNHRERGGYMKLHRPDYGRFSQEPPTQSDAPGPAEVGAEKG